MKKRYLKPTVEVYLYSPEKGFATSVALENNTRDRDYVLIEGNDRNSTRASEEVTEYTDRYGQYETGEWD
jgi:hypothetical protein